MKAIVYDRYGWPEDLRLEEVEKPIPNDDEALIRIRAVSLNRSDWEMLRGAPLYARIGGLFKPGHRILGSDIAGLVEATGKNHTQFKPGDEVFGDILMGLGGLADYVCIRGHAVALKPAGLTFEQAAAIPQAAVIALQGLRHNGQVQPGQRVLINGAGGSAGSFAVQLAKLYGATVTAVDSPAKLDFMRSLGADQVIDYTRQDFTRNGQQYDRILDVIAHRSVFAYLRALAPGGSYYFTGGSMASLFQVLLLGPSLYRLTGRRCRILAVRPNRDDLLHIAELCMAGKLTPVIDRRYPLSRAPEAIRYLGDGHPRGKVVITLDDTPA